MKNSRTDGILVFDTVVPYKAAINGNLEERTKIICHDVDSKCEGAAFDLEQLISIALTALPEQQKKAPKKQIDSDEKKAEEFYKNDSPSDSDVLSQARALRMMVQMNNRVKMTEILEVFNEFIIAGVICWDGDHRMTAPIWQTISREDKLMIVFRYIAFFVNPLEALAAMQASMENQGS